MDQTPVKAFGKHLKEKFPFDPEFHNLNHGIVHSLPASCRAQAMTHWRRIIWVDSERHPTKVEGLPDEGRATPRPLHPI